jgi:hypothetical protein
MIFRILLCIALLGLTACKDTPGEVAERTFPDPVPPVFKHVDPEPEQPLVKPDKLELARKEAAALKAQGKLFEAADRLRIGLDEEAYAIFAPEDFVLEDKTKYDDSADAQLVAAVDGKPSVKRHKMMLDGKTFWYTASARSFDRLCQKTGKTGPASLYLLHRLYARRIVESIKYAPSLKLLTVLGYYDTITTFFQSELDLKGVIIDPATNRTLLDRVPVKNFAGGHMIYYSEEARAPLKKTLDEFYDAPPYGTGPTIVKARDLVAAAPAQRAPVSAISLH